MEVTAVGPDGNAIAPAAEEPAAGDSAEVEAAFAEAVGSALFSLAMNNFSMLKEELDEIGKDQ